MGDQEDGNHQTETGSHGLTRRGFVYGATVAAAALAGSHGMQPGHRDGQGDASSVGTSSNTILTGFTLEGLYVRYYTASFTATDGNFYLMDVTGGDVTMQLPSVDSMPVNAIIGFKRVGSTNSVTIAAATGEHINGQDQISSSQAGWGRILLPFAPNGAAAGKGWMSY